MCTMYLICTLPQSKTDRSPRHATVIPVHICTSWSLLMCKTYLSTFPVIVCLHQPCLGDRNCTVHTSLPCCTWCFCTYVFSRLVESFGELHVVQQPILVGVCTLHQVGNLLPAGGGGGGVSSRSRQGNEGALYSLVVSLLGLHCLQGGDCSISHATGSHIAMQECLTVSNSLYEIMPSLFRSYSCRTVC